MTTPARGIGFVGFRTDRFAEMVALFRSTRAALEADGLEMLTEVERTEAAAWCHFRAPDGTVLEIIGPARD